MLERIAIMGRSFGGYWAAKMAFVEAKRLRASVVWGGGVHYFFQPDWLGESTNAESYLMDHDVARCNIFGVKNVAELSEVWPALSLKTQGWLEKPSCPMLIVNGKEDLQTPIAGSLHSTGIRHAEIRPRLPRRPHGPNARDPADHHALAKKGIELMSVDDFCRAVYAEPYGL